MMEEGVSGMEPIDPIFHVPIFKIYLITSWLKKGYNEFRILS